MDWTRHFRPAATVSLIALGTLTLTQAAHAAEAPWTGYDISGKPCTGVKASFGPYDYTQAYLHEHELFLVESAHFNNKVETLTSGAKQKYNLLGDIHYTLKAWPNHHRALNTVIKYRFLKGPYKNLGIKQPECYFQRALKFSPKDDVTHMLYGIYLHKIDHLDEAKAQYEKAKSLNPNNLQTLYNLGLLSLDLGDIDAAQDYADQVYKKNFPLKGLQRRIKESEAAATPEAPKE